MSQIKITLNAQEQEFFCFSIEQTEVKIHLVNIPEDTSDEVTDLRNNIEALQQELNLRQIRYETLSNQFETYRRIHPCDTEKLKAMIIAYLQRNEWINAIKEVRTQTGSSLKEAKDRVDKWRAELDENKKEG